jgi:hypothetical protein
MIYPARQMILAAALLALCMAARGAGLFAGDERPDRHLSFRGDSPISDRTFATWVDKRVQEWQVTAGERRFDEIGWAKDIRDAERLAKEHGRPVFMFTHDGRMAIGRC